MAKLICVPSMMETATPTALPWESMTGCRVALVVVFGWMRFRLPVRPQVANKTVLTWLTVTFLLRFSPKEMAEHVDPLRLDEILRRVDLQPGKSGGFLRRRQVELQQGFWVRLHSRRKGPSPSCG